MKSTRRLYQYILLILILGTSLTSLASSDDAELIITTPGDSVRDLLYIQPFVLSEPYQYQFSADHQLVSSGKILVISVDPELAKPRQADLPVLFVGDTPAELTNWGYETGNMIIIAPGDVDLAVTPIFFGSMMLPEQITKERGQEELASATALGIRPFTEIQIENALGRSAHPLRADNIVALYESIAALIEQYSPSETDLINQYNGAAAHD